MTLEERRRYLISSQKKKNWFDFSKVTGAVNRYYTEVPKSSAWVEGDKLIMNVGVYNVGLFIYDSTTVLPKGEYILSYTVYAPISEQVVMTISKKSDDLINTRIKLVYTTAELNGYKNLELPFSIDEETTIVVGLQGVGNASNWNKLKMEFTNIRIEKVG